MNPWALPVIDAASKKEIRMKFDPNSTCADAVVQLMKTFPVVSEEDYGIYVVHKNKPDQKEWLEDTKKLSVYKSLKDEVLLYFKIKPALITVKFKDETCDTFLVDKEDTAGKLIQTIAAKIALPQNQLRDYGLRFNDNDQAWLEEDVPLRYYKVKDEVRKDISSPLRIALRLFCGLLSSRSL